MRTNRNGEPLCENNCGRKADSKGFVVIDPTCRGIVKLSTCSQSCAREFWFGTPRAARLPSGASINPG